MKTEGKTKEELLAELMKSEFSKQDLVCNRMARFYCENCHTMNLEEFGEASSKKFEKETVRIIRVMKPHPTVILVFNDDSIFQMEFMPDGSEIVSTGMYVHELHTRNLH